jgi:hypothetical protein
MKAPLKLDITDRKFYTGYAPLPRTLKNALYSSSSSKDDYIIQHIKNLPPINNSLKSFLCYTSYHNRFNIVINGPVKDQQKANLCWLFASTTMLESALCIKNYTCNNYTHYVPISMQYFLNMMMMSTDCCSILLKYPEPDNRVICLLPYDRQPELPVYSSGSCHIFDVFINGPYMSEYSLANNSIYRTGILADEDLPYRCNDICNTSCSDYTNPPWITNLDKNDVTKNNSPYISSIIPPKGIPQVSSCCINEGFEHSETSSPKSKSYMLWIILLIIFIIIFIIIGLIYFSV